MKIIHLTDTHLLGADRANLYGINPAYRLKKALKSIQQSHGDAKFIVITGDLVDEATPNAYKVLKEIIQKSEIPVFLMLGNHDKRSYFSEVFPQFIEEKFCQYVHKAGKRVFIFLDTLIEDKRYGKLCEERMVWLEEKLEKYKNIPVYLFMHHHPVPSKLYEMDHLADFRTRKSFWKLIDRYENIKHIAFGHLHRILHASNGSVTLHVTRSTTFQVAYQTKNKIEYLTNKEKPTYAVMEIGRGETLMINHHEYLDEKHYYEDGTRTEL